MTREESMINVLVKENDALKSEISKLISTQEPCEDCISRETARRIVDSGRTRPQMIDMILATPSVTPQPKIGRWIISPNGCVAQCSECGLHGEKGIYEHYRWCPNCGAKMIEPREKYCDRNICASNEYNGIGCDECEVTKSREPQESEDKE